MFCWIFPLQLRKPAVPLIFGHLRDLQQIREEGMVAAKVLGSKPICSKPRNRCGIAEHIGAELVRDASPTTRHHRARPLLPVVRPVAVMVVTALLEPAPRH